MHEYREENPELLEQVNRLATLDLYRLLGLGPYVSFVINNVFTTITNREYTYLSDRWQMHDLSLSDP